MSRNLSISSRFSSLNMILRVSLESAVMSAFHLF